MPRGIRIEEKRIAPPRLRRKSPGDRIKGKLKGKENSEKDIT
jgi:hypothetical protein